MLISGYWSKQPLYCGTKCGRYCIISTYLCGCISNKYLSTCLSLYLSLCHYFLSGLQLHFKLILIFKWRCFYVSCQQWNVFTTCSELRKVLFLAPSVCGFLLVYKISREPLNGFASNSHGRHVKVKSQGQKGQKRHFSALCRPACGLCLVKHQFL